MRLFLKENRNLEETEVEIRYKERDPEVESLISAVNGLTDRLQAEKDNGETVYLKSSTILYFEAVDRFVFAYTSSEVFKVRKTLYDLEDEYRSKYFVRISKSVIVNLNAVRRIAPDEGRRLRLVLSDRETVIVSRGYVSDFKAAIGMKGDA